MNSQEDQVGIIAEQLVRVDSGVLCFYAQVHVYICEAF